jgi:tRNA A37 threonylcarbamoyladenosine dehydratase
MDRFERTRLIMGDNIMEKIKNSHVAVFGIGGVGGYAAEALARSGVGRIDLIDNDVVSKTNINRQIIALTSTVGKFKTEVMKQRILEINPTADVREYKIFFMTDTKFDFSQYDYIIDAVDTVTAKLEIITRAINCGVNVISSMGTGNKLDPTRLEVSDIYKTSVCPLARVMRRELKKRGIKKLKVVYSKEEPVTPLINITENGRHIPGSTAFVPSAAGLIIASEVIRDLSKTHQ